MRVLVFGLSSNIGGVETFYMNYYRKINKNKFFIDFVIPDDNKMAFEDEVISNGSKVFHIEKFNRNIFKYITSIKKILDDEYDVVHYNMLSCANLLPLIIAKKKNIKTIIAHSHNSSIPKSRIKKMLHLFNKKKIKKYANCLLACSSVAGNWMFGENSDFRVVNNAIEIDKFKYNENLDVQIRKEYLIDKKMFVLGNVGKFCVQKNQLFLIDVLSKLKKNNINFKAFLIGGTGELLNEVKNKIIECGIEDNIIIKENVYDIWKYYSAFDLFVLPSLFEGLPVVGVEAQANGVDCLFSNQITSDLKINDNVEFLDLNVDVWVKEIIKKLNKNKRFCVDNLTKAGFNICEEARILESIYEGKDDSEKN